MCIKAEGNFAVFYPLQLSTRWIEDGRTSVNEALPVDFTETPNVTSPDPSSLAPSSNNR